MLLIDTLEQGGYPCVAGQVRRQRLDRAQNSKPLARLFGLVCPVAHDNRTAAFGENHMGRLQTHPASAANDQKLLTFELIAHCYNSRLFKIKTIL